MLSKIVDGTGSHTPGPQYRACPPVRRGTLRRTDMPLSPAGMGMDEADDAYDGMTRDTRLCRVVHERRTSRADPEFGRPVNGVIRISTPRPGPGSRGSACSPAICPRRSPVLRDHRICPDLGSSHTHQRGVALARDPGPLRDHLSSDRALDAPYRYRWRHGKGYSNGSSARRMESGPCSGEPRVSHV